MWQTRSPSSGQLGDTWANDPSYSGPSGEYRTCTDVTCLSIFAFTFALWIITSSFVHHKFRPLPILDFEDKDNDNPIFNNSSIIRSFLFSFNSSECENKGMKCNATEVFVKECPKESWSSKPYRLGLRKFNTTEIQDKIICKNESIKRNIDTLDKLKGSVTNGDCADWYLSSVPINGRCLPSYNDVSLSLRNLEENGIPDANHTNSYSLFCFVFWWIEPSWCSPPFPPLPEEDKEVQKNHSNTTHIHKEHYEPTYLEFGEELRRSRKYIWIAVISSAGFSVLFLVLWRLVPIVMGWISILGLVSCLMYLINYFYSKEGYFRDTYGIKTYLNVTAILLVIILIYVILFILSNVRRFVLLPGIIREASSALTSVYGSIVYSVINATLRIFLIYWLTRVLYSVEEAKKPWYRAFGVNATSCVCTDVYKHLFDGDLCNVTIFRNVCRDPDTDKNCTKGGCGIATFKNGKFDPSVAITWFGFYWTYTFLTSAVSTLILAGAFADWYWNNKNGGSVLHSASRVIRYHLGTAALGSLFMPFVSIIRKILTYIRNSVVNTINAVELVCMYGFAILFWLLEFLLEYFSDHAFIMCALHGTNWLTSARNAVHLVWRNLWQVSGAAGVAIFLIRCSQAFIVVAVTWGMHLVFKADPDITPILPTVLIFLLTLIISNIIFGVLCTAIETLFVCYMEDLERNLEPYYASEELRDALEA